MKEDRYYSRSYSRQQKTINVVIQIVLLVLGIMWILPLMWIILTSFRAEPGSYTSYFWPKGFTLDNYMRLLFEDQQFKFSQWFLNTFIVAVVSCIGSTFLVLAVSYALSRLRFKMRKPMMNVALILGMFPGFMSMVAIYYILKGLGLTENPLVCLTLVYISGSGLTYYIAKGFFDTIPKSLDESAYLDGATRSQVLQDNHTAFKADNRVHRSDDVHGSLGRLHLPEHDLRSELRQLHCCAGYVQNAGA